MIIFSPLNSRSNSVDEGSPMNGLPFRQHFAKTSPDSPVGGEKGAPLHEEIARKFAGVHWQFMNGMKYEKQEVSKFARVHWQFMNGMKYEKHEVSKFARVH